MCADKGLLNAPLIRANVSAFFGWPCSLQHERPLMFGVERCSESWTSALSRYQKKAGHLPRVDVRA